MNPAVISYLEGLDAHLAKVGDVEKRMSLLDGERLRVDRLERALGEWALCDRNLAQQPTRFSAFDLAFLHGALSSRLASLDEARDAALARRRGDAGNPRFSMIGGEARPRSPAIKSPPKSL